MSTIEQIDTKCQRNEVIMADRRNRKTKNAIIEAFLNIVEKKDISKITILELCDKADISRGTFYLHYQDIYELYSEIESDTLVEIGELFDKSLMNRKPIYYADFLEKTAEYLLDHKRIAKLFLNEKTSFTFLKRVKFYFVDKEIKGKDDKEDTYENTSYQVAYKAAGIVGVLQQWVETGMQLSPKDLSKLIRI